MLNGAVLFLSVSVFLLSTSLTPVKDRLSIPTPEDVVCAIKQIQ